MMDRREGNQMTMKKLIRKVFRAREKESFRDTVDRHVTSLEKRIYRKRYTRDTLMREVKNCGLSAGDTVFVQCSWRKFFNFEGSPEDVIHGLEAIVGENGTIAMPCYGADRAFLDIRNTPSAAGVLSEEFRWVDGVKRSECTHFSVAAKGKNADYLLCDHVNSTYGFDVHSPCYRLTTIPNAKILFLGLGKKPVKISVFHCAGGRLMDTDAKMRKLLSRHYEATLVDAEGKKHRRDMVIRQPGHGNDDKVIRKIFEVLKKKKTARISNLDIVMIDAGEAYAKALEYAEKGIYCYKNIK